MRKRALFPVMSIACLLLVLTVFLVSNRFGAKEPEPKIEAAKQTQQDVSSNELSDSSLLSETEMKEDLDYLLSTLGQVHPSHIDGWNEEQKNVIEQIYRSASQQPLTLERFYFGADEIVALLHDAHTNISPASSSTYFLNLPLFWTPEGPVVLRSTPELQRGDLLLELGGLTPPKLLDQLSKVIPAENENWVKVQGVSLQASKAFLDRLNLLEDGKSRLKIDRNGEIIEAELPLVNRPQYLGLSNTPYEVGGSFFNYSIDERLSLGLLRINTCAVNDEYLDTVADFFAEVRQKGIQHIAVDLRNNLGGDSTVIDVFMSYVDVDEYRSYGLASLLSSSRRKIRRRRG
ncbi:hypothetical protein [Paenibacillus macerans]|uniref:hypothetical protein n=1 Tax=Paenibacillus macerans TaxID=44252 RepID=UPI003D31F6F8